MYKILDDNTILLTRGDTFDCDVNVFNGSEPYSPASGDVFKFYVKHPCMNATRSEYTETTPLITKTLSSLSIHLDPSDTKSLGFGSYVYDVELTYANGGVDTFINNANLVLLPEVH